MKEKVIVKFEGRPEGGEAVGVKYKPATPEAGASDRLMAVELALHALAQDAIRGRQEMGLPVPDVLQAVVEGCTFRELI
ncbi:MAG: hypothetical protein IT210_06545 [Armatimonadetes bacterium]|nr:hypothetical protein [Armatimonadota bacterium]